MATGRSAFDAVLNARYKRELKIPRQLAEGATPARDATFNPVRLVAGPFGIAACGLERQTTMILRRLGPGRIAIASVLLPLVLCPQVALPAVDVAKSDEQSYRVTFSFQAPPGTSSVHLAGSFNGWSPTADPMHDCGTNGVYTITRSLPAGRHEYKFVINGDTWMSDPANPHKTPGYGNSVLYLGVEPEQEPASVRPVVAAHRPAEIKDLTAELDQASKAGAQPKLDDWFRNHPMPLCSDNAVSFVFDDPQAKSVRLRLLIAVSPTDLPMVRLRPEQPVFAVSLDLDSLPDRTAYVLEVTSPAGTSELVDPHAWSLTSRSGHPVGAVVEASRQRGRIEVIEHVQAVAGHLIPRDVYVYLPPGYDESSEKRYPVLYMQDGQNCWDDPVEPFGHGGWCMNIMADRLIAAGSVQPFIIAAAANTPQRMSDYGPGPRIDSAVEQTYIRFLVEDLKPLIDRRYRTQADSPRTCLMGSSMGANISLQAALLHPDVFPQVACLSPALMFKDGSGHDYFDLIGSVGKKPVRLYVDHGTGGPHQDGAPLTRRLVEALRAAGWHDGVDLMYYEDTGAEHNERAWRARVHRPLLFLFGEGRKG